MSTVRGSLCVRTSSSCAATELFRIADDGKLSRSVEEERAPAALCKVARA